MMYALDSNTISHILRGNETAMRRWRKEEEVGNRSIIPPITYYEVKRGLIAANAVVKLAAFERLCNAFGVDTVDIKTLDEAAEIYAALKKSGKLIEDDDILIAASCIAHDYTLVTDNVKHFGRVDGLQYVNWLE